MSPEARLGAALAAEHAAVYAYAPIGVHLDGRRAKAARAAEAAHRTRRDAVALRLTELGAETPPAEPAYALPFDLAGTDDALQLAVLIEERTGAVWRAALPETADEDRRMALDALVDCAVRATRWRRAAGVEPATVALPGAPT